MSNSKRKKEINARMIERSTEIRMMTGHGQTREQLMNDTEWAKLNAELEILDKIKK